MILRVALIAVVVMIGGCKRSPTPFLVIPAADEVSEVKASLLDSRTTGIGFEPITEFVVPAEHVPKILGWLRATVYEPSPPIFPNDELGEVVIHTRDGRELRLRFFTAGHNPAVVTPDGVNYFYGWHDGIDRGRNSPSDPPPAVDGGVRLGQAIRDAQQAAKR